MTLHAALPFHPTDSLPSQRGEVGTGEVRTLAVSVGGTQVTNTRCLPVLACSPLWSHLAGWDRQHSRAEPGIGCSDQGMGCCADLPSLTGQHTLFKLVRRRGAVPTTI